MSDPEELSNLPAQIAQALVAIPKGLTPAALKALDRLIGAAVDIPVAWLGQKKAKIDAQTEAYAAVEAAIAKSAAAEAGGDQETVSRAVAVLVRKAYRKQTNREAVAAAMVEDLASAKEEPPPAGADADTEVDEDWLNVFERYAEDASTERMQRLWGRVLAGELRRPGRFSARTLRFLSEFSQKDALTLDQLSKSAFSDIVPKKLAIPEGQGDIRDLIYLEANGLIQGASGLGLTFTLNFNSGGICFMREGSFAILLKGAPNLKLETGAIALTPLGQELVGLLPSRDVRAAAIAVAHGMRVPQIVEAVLAVVVQPGDRLQPIQMLWRDAAPATD